MHARADRANREMIEPVIYSKAIDYQRDVRRGAIKVNPATDRLFARYREQVKA
jgi:hypothetical protein